MKARILVVGLGRSGIGAAKLLNAEGHPVIVLEEKEGNEFLEISNNLESKGIHVKLGKDLNLDNLSPFVEQIKSVVLSPGVPWNHPTLNYLRNKGIKIEGEMALAWERLKGTPWIGITGTNGKTTVTYMLQHVLEGNGLIAPMAGNMGYSGTELALKLTNQSQRKLDWLIVELSSYQIEAAEQIRPRIGIWTNLTPDHLERHGTMEKYRQIKRSLLEKSQIQILNADDEEIVQQKPSLKNGIWVSTEGPNNEKISADYWINNTGMILERGEPIFHSSTLKLNGKHNLQNLLLVIAAAREAGLNVNQIEESIKTFKGVPHRLERVGTLQGMTIFNDSKATNYSSSLMGLNAVLPPTVLLAGGQIKAGDPNQWLETIKQKACGVILFGKSAYKLKEIIQSSGFRGEIGCYKDLNQACIEAVKMSLKSNAKSLLLSPACASFDQYKSFEERGDHFKTLLKVILEKK